MKFFTYNIGNAQHDELIDLKSYPFKNGLLIRSNNWLGDAVMTLPMVYALKKALPKDIPLKIVCKDALSGFWLCYEFIDEVISFLGRRVDRHTRKKLKEFSPDLTIVLPNSFGSAWDVHYRGAKILGRSNSFLRKKILSYHLESFDKSSFRGCHQVTEYFQFAQALGLKDVKKKISFPEPLIELSEEEIAFLEVNPFFKDYLILAPGAQYGQAKQWRVEYFAEIANYWDSSRGKVILVGAESDEQVAKQVSHLAPNCINLVGKTEVKDLMFLLQLCKYVITNDSGVMHVAASLNLKGIAIFGSTSEVLTGPLAGQWIILNKNLSCSPCFKRQCYLEEGRKYECLNTITPELVIKALDTLKDSN